MHAEILMTGATGLLGAAVCAEVWRSGAAGNWMLLVRSRGGCPRGRIAAGLTPHLGETEARRASVAFGVLVGSLSDLPALVPGLSGVRRILHLAADTSFAARSGVWSANFDGTMALGAAARRMPRLDRLLHVGTAFRCGEAPRGELMKEMAPPGPHASHIVEYTRSKAAAEGALVAGFQEIPIVVALPSIIAGHSGLGCGPSASIFWFFRALDRMGVAPIGPDGWIDVVPSDWAARALLALLEAPSLAHGLYHVSAGEASRTSLRGIARRFGELGHGGGGPWVPFDMASEWCVADRAFRLAFPSQDAVSRTMIQAVRKYCRFVAQGLTFVNERLLAEGIPPSPSLDSYMEACLRLPGTDVREMFLDDAGAFEPTLAA